MSREVRAGIQKLLKIWGEEMVGSYNFGLRAEHTCDSYARWRHLNGTVYVEVWEPNNPTIRWYGVNGKLNRYGLPAVLDVTSAMYYTDGRLDKTIAAPVKNETPGSNLTHHVGDHGGHKSTLPTVGRHSDWHEWAWGPKS